MGPQLFKDLEAGKWKPFYLVLGEEPFQAEEIGARLKAFFVRGEMSDSFNYESWDGEHLDVGRLIASLDTLPSLFDAPDSLRLVSCSRFEKVPGSALGTLETYFANPSPSTAFLIFANKVDKRKTWYRHVETKGYVIEINEPRDREWPRWQGALERRLDKKIESEAWEIVVENSGHVLSVVWTELQKIATYVGERSTITRKDVVAFSVAASGGDVFQFVDEVVCRRAYPSMKKFDELVRGGEAEIKLLSLLVRQFRLIDQYLKLGKRGVSDPKQIASEIGMPPFLVSKVRGQSQYHSSEELEGILAQLAECDFLMKTGEGSLFEHFFVPYFGADKKEVFIRTKFLPHLG